jgi:transcriptional regulator
MTEEQLAAAYLAQSPLCTLVNCDSTAGYQVTRVPVVVLPGPGTMRLGGHVARRNPHWRFWERPNRTLCVVTGPHGYVSPRCYEAQPAVPTSNHVTVSLEGQVAILTDPQAAMEQTIAQLAGQDPSLYVALDDATRTYYQRLLSEIVAFQMRVERVTRTEKLSFHRSAEDQRRISAFIDDHQPRDVYGETVRWRRGQVVTGVDDQ